MQTSLIIPCYFADESFVEMTKKCLDSLKYGRPDEVIAVDDGSPIHPSRPKGILWFERFFNGGYAAAVNAGLHTATGDILIISNNDIIFTPGWLPAILKPLNEGYDISSIVTSDSGWETRDEITEGDKFGSLWAMKREVYEELGGLDESFGNYFEDLDYQKRAEAAGFKVGKNWNHLVEHEGKATFKIVDPDDRQYLEAREKYKAKWGKVE